MSGTIRTTAYLLNQFRPGLPAARQDPQDIEDLITTVAATSGNFANVVAYGADPTGVADSTTAFQNAMAAGVALVPALRPSGTQAVYLLNNCIVPSGGQLIGFNPLIYSDGTLNASDIYARPLILPLNGSTVRVLNVDSHYGMLLQGLMIDATGIATGLCDGISAGGRDLTLRDMSVGGCRFGLGGQVTGSTATDPQASRICNIFNSQFTYCVTGVGDLIDSWVFGGACTTCSNGWLTTSSGSGGATWVGTRFEECGSSEYPRTHGPASGWGVQTVTGCNDITFKGCFFDQNGNGGASVADGWTVFSGCQFRRNGFNPTSNGGTTLIAASCHLQFNGANHVEVTGCMTHEWQATWGSASVYCPAAAVNFVGSASNNKAISFVGNDLSGYLGTTAGATDAGPHSSNTLWFTGTAPTGTGIAAFVVKNNIGTGTAAQDVDTR